MLLCRLLAGHHIRFTFLPAFLQFRFDIEQRFAASDLDRLGRFLSSLTLRHVGREDIRCRRSLPAVSFPAIRLPAVGFRRVFGSRLVLAGWGGRRLGAGSVRHLPS